MARTATENLIPEKISPHCLRHSKAMHLLQAGVNLVYIRDILGHVSIQTTEVYARADSKQKREALEKTYTSILPQEEDNKPSWESDSELKSWLKKLRTVVILSKVMAKSIPDKQLIISRAKVVLWIIFYL